MIQQQPHHRGIAVSNRKQQRRHPAVGVGKRALPDDPVSGRPASARGHVFSFGDRDVGMGINVGAARQQQLHNVGVIFEHGPHQRGLPMHRVFGIDVCAPIEKQCNRVDLAGASRSHESSFATRIGAVRIDAGVQQFADHGRVSIDGRQIDRRDAVPVRGLRVRARLDQRFGACKIIVSRRPV